MSLDLESNDRGCNKLPICPSEMKMHFEKIFILHRNLIRMRKSRGSERLSNWPKVGPVRCWQRLDSIPSGPCSKEDERSGGSKWVGVLAINAVPPPVDPYKHVNGLFDVLHVVFRVIQYKKA